jgi:hypothetical protein
MGCGWAAATEGVFTAEHYVAAVCGPSLGAMHARWGGLAVETAHSVSVVERFFEVERDLSR